LTSNLSTGAKVGIGAAVVLGLIYFLGKK
jgi:hypothetical protein